MMAGVLVVSIGQAAEPVVPHMLLLDGALAGSAVIAVGERGTILHSTDNAQTWRRAESKATATLTGVTFAPDGKRGWAVGHDALILASTDAGQTWSQQYQSENLQDSFLDVIALDAQHVLAIGAYGLFAATTNGGKTWTRRKISDDDYHFNRISRGPAGTLYLAGEHGTLFRSVDRGSRWTKIPTPYEGSFYGILPLDARTLLAHGLRGRMYRSTNNGDAWELVATPLTGMLATAVKLRSNFIVLAGNARGMLVSRDYGKTTTELTPGLATAVAELVELADGNVLALGDAGATVFPAPK